jgi:hypothetical protein
MTKHFEKCRMCSRPAWHKVGEEVNKAVWSETDLGVDG